MSAPTVEPQIDATNAVPAPTEPAAPATADGHGAAVMFNALPQETAAPTGPRPQTGGRLELLHNVEMAVTAELGRTKMTVRNLLSLTPGNVVELDRSAGSPVDLFVNGTLIARGEVVVIDEEFGIRISEIISSGFEGAAVGA